MIIPYWTSFQEIGKIDMLSSEPNTNKDSFQDARVDGSSEGEYVDCLIDTQGNATE